VDEYNGEWAIDIEIKLKGMVDFGCSETQTWNLTKFTPVLDLPAGFWLIVEK
jgi:hypothetical protein